MRIRTLLSISLAFILAACVGGTQPIKFQGTGALTKDEYLRSKDRDGVVLLDINWGRWWGCGGRENAQLVSLAFDKIPANSLKNEAAPSLVIHSPSRLMVDPVFVNNAYSLKPGKYALSAFSIKVADSGSRVGFLTADRSRLFKDGEPIGGTFTVKTGEVVFIGNFYLDCAYGPTLWRYYPEGRADFNKQMQEYKARYPFLDLSNVQYRLFKTNEFGHDYELPQ